MRERVSGAQTGEDGGIDAGAAVEEIVAGAEGDQRCRRNGEVVDGWTCNDRGSRVGRALKDGEVVAGKGHAVRAEREIEGVAIAADRARYAVVRRECEGHIDGGAILKC